jgi:putative membrane protein
MAVTTRVRSGVRARPVTVTVLLSVVGYGLVIGTFLGLLDGIYPSLNESQADLLSLGILLTNAGALALLVAGVYFIANRRVRYHRMAMVSAFSLILLFLVIYMLRVGGFGEKEIVAGSLVTTAYRAMLAIHILLSIVSVPVVIYVVVMGLTHSPRELAESPKARVGRIAASAWILSLFLGVVTNLMLNHIYESQIRSLAVLALVAPVSGRAAAAVLWRHLTGEAVTDGSE